MDLVLFAEIVPANIIICLQRKVFPGALLSVSIESE